MASIDRLIISRLLKRRKITNKGCWEYTRYVNNTGYGQMYYNDSLWLVHRLSFKMFKPNEFRSFLWVLHKCDNRKCFNPDHLYMGTPYDNHRDAVERSGWKNINKGIKHCKYGHEFSVENTYIVPSTGYRQCRICKNEGMILRRMEGKRS